MATKKVEVVNIEPLKIEHRQITIVGDTPLIVHAWSEKAKKEMLEKQQKKTKTSAKAIRDPFAEFMNACYWITEKPTDDTEQAFAKAIQDGAKFGFPVTAIKQAAQSTLYRLGVIPNQMIMRGAFFIRGIGENQLGEIITPYPPECREDMVKIGGISKTSDLRYRPCFNDWKMVLDIEYNASSDITWEQIVNGINTAGFMNGIGEWRPEKDGPYGRFHVESC